MLRRAFLGMLAALPFVGKVKPKQKAGDFKLSDLNDMREFCTFGPAHGAKLSTWIEWRIRELAFMVADHVTKEITVYKPRSSRAVLRLFSPLVGGGYYQTISMHCDDLDRLRGAADAVKYVKVKKTMFSLAFEDVIANDTRFTVEQKIEILRSGEARIEVHPWIS